MVHAHIHCMCSNHLPRSMDYFHFHPASLSTNVAKKQMAQPPSQHMLTHPNSQWNAAVDWPSRAAPANSQRSVTVLPPGGCVYEVARSASVQWSAGSNVTTEWSRVPNIGLCQTSKSQQKNNYPVKHEKRKEVPRMAITAGGVEMVVKYSLGGRTALYVEFRLYGFIR